MKRSAQPPYWVQPATTRDELIDLFGPTAPEDFARIDAMIAQHKRERRPAWHTPSIKRIDITRTAAQCGSGQDWEAGET